VRFSPSAFASLARMLRLSALHHLPACQGWCAGFQPHFGCRAWPAVKHEPRHEREVRESLAPGEPATVHLLPCRQLSPFLAGLHDQQGCPGPGHFPFLRTPRPCQPSPVRMGGTGAMCGCSYSVARCMRIPFLGPCLQLALLP